MVEKEKGFDYSIKGKLISAIAMLMVAVIMVVSSTYAWFTLSTAPEVTGISTAVGANGALEMLLLTWDDVAGKWVYNDGVVKSGDDENTYWGNLVDLSKEIYGSKDIVLYPAVLNVDDGKINDTDPIKIPEYGADGRPSALKSAGRFGTYENGTFIPSDDAYGFRALGDVSGLTPREQAFRTTVSAIGTAINSALKAARSSLNDNGTTLGSIAITHAMPSSSGEYYSANELKSIESMISTLEVSLKSLEDAYINAIAAYALSSLNSNGDEIAITAANTIKAHLTNESESAKLGDRLQGALNDLDTLGLKSAVETLLGQYGYGNEKPYNKALTAVSNATSQYENIKSKVDQAISSGKGDEKTFEWTDFNGALTQLLDTSKVTVNGFATSEVRDHVNDLVAAATSGTGLIVYIPSGGGVYADVADLCSDYTVDIKLDITYNGLTVNDMPAKMKADSTNDDEYLTKLKDNINSTPPSSDSDTVRALSEFYGYVIDLAFKTNAASSNLLLQYDAVDRIYGDNNNESTMGGGSTMTFDSSAPEFTTEQVKSLMSNIRVVFFDTDSWTIYAEARLDMSTAELDTAGVTAQLKIYQTYENRYEYDEGSSKITLYSKSEDDGTVKYYTDEGCTSEYGSSVVDANLTKIAGAFVGQSDAVISALDQNVIKNISALVYLDGESITNADVAATAATSMTGTLNLQFASSATLVPMEYGDLHTPNGGSADTTSTGQP